MLYNTAKWFTAKKAKAIEVVILIIASSRTVMLLLWLRGERERESLWAVACSRGIICVGGSACLSAGGYRVACMQRHDEIAHCHGFFLSLSLTGFLPTLPFLSFSIIPPPPIFFCCYCCKFYANHYFLVIYTFLWRIFFFTYRMLVYVYI